MVAVEDGNGGKNRRRAKNESENDRRELVFKEDGQEYAQVVKMLGNGRIEAFCFDGETRISHIRGKLRKKVWINVGDIILVSLREFQDGRGDVILKYNADEARNLKSYGELPESAKINETNFNKDGDEDDVNFEENYDDDNDDDNDLIANTNRRDTSEEDSEEYDENYEYSYGGSKKADSDEDDFISKI